MQIKKNLADLVRFELGLDQFKKVREHLSPTAIYNLIIRGYLTAAEGIYIFENVPKKFAEGGYIGAAVEGGLIIALYQAGKYLMNYIFDYIDKIPNEPSLTKTRA